LIHINVAMATGGIYNSRLTVPYERKKLIMNWDQIEGKWKEFSAKVQAEWGKLTENLDVIKGRRTKLEGDPQKRNEFTADKAKTEVDSRPSDMK
jgi:uncharacterized protein YjbJ (UPF0337 family)